jgi:hypothetical protein
MLLGIASAGFNDRAPLAGEAACQLSERGGDGRHLDGLESRSCHSVSQTQLEYFDDNSPSRT